MAIVIPSKHIYDMQNPKIVKNVVEKIEINSNNIYNENTYESRVFGTKVYCETSQASIEENPNKKSFLFQVDGIVGRTFYALVYFDNKLGYYTGKISIPKLLKNKSIEKLTYGDKNFFQYSTIGRKITKTCSANVYKSASTPISKATMSEISYGTPKEETLVLNFPETPIEITKKYSGINTPVNASVTGLTKKEDVVEFEELENSFEVSFTILTYMLVEELTGIYNHASGDYNDQTIPIKGTSTEYIADEIEITIYGNTIGIGIENEVIKLYSQGNENTKNVFSIDNNELIQNSSYSQTGENAIVKNYGKTLDEYAKGKETATLLCSISEYYNEQGELAISTKDQSLPMQFEIGNEVVPMIMNNKGEDVPMSKDKVFQVVGNEVYYDGAVWQKITLLQK